MARPAWRRRVRRKHGIDLVVLVPQKLTPGEPVDPSRGNDTDLMPGIVHEGGQFITVGARGLQEDVGLIDPLCTEPPQQSLKILLIVREDLLLQFVIDEQCRVDLPIDDIHAEHRI